MEGEIGEVAKEILTPECVKFLSVLHKKYSEARVYILSQRRISDKQIAREGGLSLLSQTADVRAATWTVTAIPKDLQKRHVEITGPAEAKMIISALNSGANVFMADLEDSLSPTWNNILKGQRALSEAVRGSLTFTSEVGKKYELGSNLATLIVRPRGWHLLEKNFLVDQEPMSASLFDFGVHFFNNSKRLLENGSGPYFYLPKMESFLEARLWNSIFDFSEDYLQIPLGTIKCTALIETITAAFQMEEILFELKEHIVGLNAGRWDYLFSLIKKFHSHPNFVLPDRSQVTMNAPFMEAYCRLLVATCHKRGAHAIGGMSAFIPNRKEPQVTEQALKQVAADKQRESKLGFDGTWVAHPDLIPVARQEFVNVLGDRDHQKEAQAVIPTQEFGKLLKVDAHQPITISGLKLNIDVALQYLCNWLQGTGAVGIYNLMEDAATAEISRSQIWQWISHQARTEEGKTVTTNLYSVLADDVCLQLQLHFQPSVLRRARVLLDNVVLSPDFSEFLTLNAYEQL
ncbi:MAG: malate synthase A [Pseudobdellovibrionaceae bacterium]